MSPDANRHVVERAMRAVPREHFLPPAEREHAHIDTPLPIACGQTCSQPSLVAYMTERLALTPTSRVLEIGTGSGYQAAILAQIAADVYTVERFERLSGEAVERLAGLGYRNIHFRVGDGALGWPERAPFDAIIVTAAPRMLPGALVAQLSAGGRLVIPIGEPYGEQRLVFLEKAASGSLLERDLLGVRFVPLVSDTQASP